MPRTFRGRSGRPNDYDWSLSFIAQTQVVAAGVAQFSLFQADKAETLMRIRGSVSAQLDLGGSTASDACTIGFGLIVGSRGSTIGASPLTDGNANWLWFTAFTLAAEYPVAVGSNQLLQQHRVEVDNKAMRKLREDEDIFLIVENQDANGAPVVLVNGVFRALTVA